MNAPAQGLRLRVLLVLVLVAGIPAGMRAQGTVYPDPAVPRPGFKPHEMPFHLPDDSVARAEYRSRSFYAIILKTTPACGVTEEARLQAQALWPHRKVFFPRFECDAEETIAYTNVNPAFGFLAVYAGATRGEAERFLAVVNQTGQFPGANIRRMQAVLVYP